MIKMKTKKITIALILLLYIICLSSCSTDEYQSNEAGLFTGIWDGFIILFTLIVKCLGSDIVLFAEQNAGDEYWIGYFFGAILFSYICNLRIK